MKTILIELKTVYGKTTIYPANEAADLLAEIAGTKTLTNVTLALAERLGFEIVEKIAAKTGYGKGSPALVNVKGALAALSQNATFPADIAAAKSFLENAVIEMEA